MSRINSYKANVNCLVINRITQAMPSERIDVQKLQMPADIRLADPNFHEPSQIDLLLGAEIFFDMMCNEKIKLFKSQPTWQNTLLG